MTSQAAAGSAEPQQIYRQRLTHFEERRDSLQRSTDKLAAARMVAFLGAGICVLLSIDTRGSPAAMFLAAGAVALTAAFGVLVTVHGRLRKQLRLVTELSAINREALARLHRQWNAVPYRGTTAVLSSHPYADDLDVFGRASLFHLLAVCGTTPGRETLAFWLTEPAEPSVVLERQAAVAELAPKIDLREQLTARGRMVGEVSTDAVHRFLRWSGREPWLLHRGGLIWLARLLAIATPALLVLHIFGAIDSAIWGVPIAVAIGITWRTKARVKDEFAETSTGEGGVGRYADVFGLLQGASFRAPVLIGISSRLRSGSGASRLMRRLDRLVVCADFRFSSLHFVIQALTLWDLHVLWALERWRREAGSAVEDWMRGLGMVEGLAALAAVYHAHPTWSFPTLVRHNADRPKIEAQRLGHPLLEPKRCVLNDVAIGPPGTFLLVTGSNMSGKSTLLRAIGTNVVLAQAGGPVCATSLRLPPVTLYTSMRIRDSLEAGLSQYMAGVKRLKQIVDAAAVQASDTNGRTLLYLLDEVLQGTNSAERQIAVRRVIQHLLAAGAVGAVTTHDLGLAGDSMLQRAAVAVHFRETIESNAGEASLSFDYRLRSGIARSTNALKLLEIVGLE